MGEPHASVCLTPGESAHPRNPLTAQKEDSLLHILLPSQCSIQDVSRYFISVVCRTVFSIVGSMNSFAFLFFSVQGTSSILPGLRDSFLALHHLCSIFRAHCLSPETVLRNFPVNQEGQVICLPVCIRAFFV